MCHERLSNTSVYLQSIFNLAIPTVLPHPLHQAPLGHKGSPDLQVQDHLSAVALVCVCLDAVDPGALEEMPGSGGGGGGRE